MAFGIVLEVISMALGVSPQIKDSHKIQGIVSLQLAEVIGTQKTSQSFVHLGLFTVHLLTIFKKPTIALSFGLPFSLFHIHVHPYVCLTL